MIEHVSALARRVDDAAVDARALASRLEAVAAVGWRSTAATAFRERLAAQAGAVRHCASGLDGLAAALREHAAAMRRDAG